MPVARIGKSLEREENSLLAALPTRELNLLLPHLERTKLAFDQTLYEPEEAIKHVYFPTSGIISLVVVLDKGVVAEVGRVGNEGMIGLPVFLGVKASHTRAFVQVSGEALRMGSKEFLRQARNRSPLSSLLLRYAQALMAHSERLTACNTWHTIEERLCRWLMVTQDRVQAEVIEVTQEFLSQMLGAHRQSVTLAARNLQRAGLIRYRRGKLRILDRQGLEEASCGCYRAIQRHFDELFASIGG